MAKDLNTLIAKKQAGINRMRARQKRVHERMAELVETQPEIMESALKKVKQKLTHSTAITLELYTEWYDILSKWSADRIATLLRSDSEEHEQLRACAPFDFAKA